jgi:hypothetical protein
LLTPTANSTVVITVDPAARESKKTGASRRLIRSRANADDVYLCSSQRQVSELSLIYAVGGTVVSGVRRLERCQSTAATKALTDVAAEQLRDANRSKIIT